MAPEVVRFQAKPGAREEITARQAWYDREIPGAHYKPLSINIQGDLTCPVNCDGCAIDAIPNKLKAKKLPKSLRIEILEQAEKLGIVSYIASVSNAEPMTDLPFLVELIERFQGRIELTKLNTSTVTFNTVQSAKAQLRQLRDAGFHKTRFFRPILPLSLGMQQNLVPFDNIVNGIIAFQEVFTREEVGLYISHYYTTTLYGDMLDKLRDALKRTSGLILDEVADIKSWILAPSGRAEEFDNDEFYTRTVGEYVDDRNCFGTYVGEFIQPAIQVDENGDILICPIFDVYAGLRFGNIHQISLHDAIVKVNQHPFYRLIAFGGTKALYEIIREVKPEISDVRVANRHRACRVLFETYSSTPALQEQVAAKVAAKNEFRPYWIQ